MDKVNKNLKPIAIGATAAVMAGLVYYFLFKDSKEQQMVLDVEEVSKAVSSENWPNMHRIIDPRGSKSD